MNSSQGDVCRGLQLCCLGKNAPCVVKVMSKFSKKIDDVMREVAILKKIDHPGLLKMIDFMNYDNDFVLITEL